jgi:MFS family permease
MHRRLLEDSSPHAWYKWYVLTILTIVYSFNLIDRQIITILAPYLKTDLGIGDAQLGLLYGTTFALFYGVFGVALARLADGWDRVRTLALGLSFWSLMTTVSGTAQTFTQLGVARIGVGVGEASSSPAAISLLSDYFERSKLGTVLGLYSVGVYVGAGASLMIGGSIVAMWAKAFGNAATAPFRLAGWQAAFITVGLPGIILAVIVLLTIREPARSLATAQPTGVARGPFAGAMRELGAMIPPWTWLRLRADGAARMEHVRNALWFGGSILFIIGATTLTNSMLSPGRRVPLGSISGIEVTNNLLQWAAIGIACYAFASWFQSIRLTDRLAYRLITGSKTFRALIAAGAFLAFAMNSANGFVFVYAHRYLGLTAEAGLRLGVISVALGGVGMALGGYLCDVARRIHPAGRLVFAGITSAIFTVASLIQFLTNSITVFYLAFAVATLFVPMWFGPLLATTQDLVVPRLRGAAFAALTLGTVIFGLGLGPYSVGLISDAAGNLRIAMLASVSIFPAALLSLGSAIRTLAADEAAAGIAAEAE